MCDRFRPIPDLPDYYASSEGQIYGPDGAGGFRLLPATTNRNGYVSVSVKTGRRWVNRRRARLVASAWHGRPPTPKAVARHANHVRDDDRPENLLWGSQKDNVMDSVKAGRYPRGERHHRAKVSNQTAFAVREAHALGAKPADIMKRYGITRFNLYDIVNGRSFKEPPKADGSEPALAV